MIFFHNLGYRLKAGIRESHREPMSNIILLARCEFPLVNSTTRPRGASPYGMSPRYLLGLDSNRGGLCKTTISTHSVRGRCRACGLDHGAISDVKYIQASIKLAGRLLLAEALNRGIGLSQKIPNKNDERTDSCKSITKSFREPLA